MDLNNIIIVATTLARMIACTPFIRFLADRIQLALVKLVTSSQNLCLLLLKVKNYRGALDNLLECLAFLIFDLVQYGIDVGPLFDCP